MLLEFPAVGAVPPCHFTVGVAPSIVIAVLYALVTAPVATKTATVADCPLARNELSAVPLLARKLIVQGLVVAVL
jgi:hypothetical protein